MNTKSLYTIPGETNVRDNNWKEVMKEVNIQPRSVIVKVDWKTDTAALMTSPKEFANRANTWPSSLKNNRNQYFPTQGKGREEDFFGPLAYCGVCIRY